MTPYTIHGITINANEEGAGAFDCSNPESIHATDTGPQGMVAELEAFLRITTKMKTLLDVGALFGMFSLLFTARKGTKAFAIEPSDMAFPILEEHCAANPKHRIAPLQLFVGDTEGRHVHCTRDWKHIIANLNRPPNETLEVIESRIDDLAIEWTDCMKIDVEAYECQVLRGAEKLIRKCKPIIFLEAHTNNLPDNGESAESLMDILRGFAYRVTHYDGSPVRSFADYSMTRVVCWPN